MVYLTVLVCLVWVSVVVRWFGIWDCLVLWVLLGCGWIGLVFIVGLWCDW